MQTRNEATQTGVLVYKYFHNIFCLVKYFHMGKIQLFLWIFKWNMCVIPKSKKLHQKSQYFVNNICSNTVWNNFPLDKHDTLPITLVGTTLSFLLCSLSADVWLYANSIYSVKTCIVQMFHYFRNIERRGNYYWGMKNSNIIDTCYTVMYM